MRRAASFLLLGGLVALSAATAGAQQDGPSVLVAEADGSIDGVLASFVRDAIADAEATGSTLVLQLDSAGTLDVDPVALAEQIHDASVPVIVEFCPEARRAMAKSALANVTPSSGDSSR